MQGLSWFYTLLLVCLFISTGSTCALIPFELQLGSTLKKVVNEDLVFCCNSHSEHGMFSIFEELLIDVREVQNKKLAWYSVKGVSTDDLHALMERIVYAAFGKSQLHSQIEPEPFEVEGFVRDLASSCPNPLFAETRTKCTMRFSTVGKACVTVKAPDSSVAQLVQVPEVSVSAEKKLNINLLFRLLVGSLLVFMSGYLGYNMIFQYTMCAVAFMIGGVLIVFVLLVNYLINARNQYATFLRSLLVALLLSGVYATSLVWYLRTHWNVIILQYWEYVLGYLFCSGVVGLVFMQVQRKEDQMKHTIAVSVKWALRGIGIVIVYHSSSSPLGSVILLSILSVNYFIYEMVKWARRSPTAALKIGEKKRAKKNE